MIQVGKLFLMCYLVASARSVENATASLKFESSLTTSAAPTSTSSSATEETKVPTPSQLPVDILSPDKVFLDPKIVLARVTRDTYGGWTYKQDSTRFDSGYVRRPFGIDGYYAQNRLKAFNEPKRRSSYVKRARVTRRPFRVYPVFPG